MQPQQSDAPTGTTFVQSRYEYIDWEPIGSHVGYSEERNGSTDMDAWMNEMEKHVFYRALKRKAAVTVLLGAYLGVAITPFASAEGTMKLPNGSSTRASKIKIYVPEADSITINGMTVPVGKRKVRVTGADSVEVRSRTFGDQTKTDIVLRTVPPTQAPIAPPRAVSVPQAVPFAPPLSHSQPSTLTGNLITDLRRRSLSIPIAGYSPKLMRGNFYQMRGARLHSAVDMLAPRNTPILAVESGTIGRLFTSKAGGLTIYQKSPDGKFVYYYAHLERYAANLKEGDRVARNQVIGYVGTSGNAPPNTPHLHFAISKIDGTSVFRGTAIDPFEVFNNELSAAQIR